MTKLFKLYKPYGYLSQFVNNQNKRRNKKLLSELSHIPDGLMAIGRLDEKSEGLILLTNDGKLSSHFTSSNVAKTYWVEVDGIISEKAIDNLKNGVRITIKKESYLTKPARAKLLIDPIVHERFVRESKHGLTSWIEITINEGKFRQIRKMTAAVGHPTLRLIRVKIGIHKIENMDPGDLIEITQ